MSSGEDDTAGDVWIAKEAEASRLISACVHPVGKFPCCRSVSVGYGVIVTEDWLQRLLATNSVATLISTAMHKALSLVDIIRLITDNISYGELKSAVALACCSKSISAPTLDSLWREQTDFGTLLVSTLPPSTWKVINDEFVSSPSGRVKVKMIYTDPGFSCGTLRRTMGPVFCLCSSDARDY